MPQSVEEALSDVEATDVVEERAPQELGDEVDDLGHRVRPRLDRGEVRRDRHTADDRSTLRILDEDPGPATCHGVELGGVELVVRTDDTRVAREGEAREGLLGRVLGDSTGDARRNVEALDEGLEAIDGRRSRVRRSHPEAAVRVAATRRRDGVRDTVQVRKATYDECRATNADREGLLDETRGQSRRRVVPIVVLSW